MVSILLSEEYQKDANELVKLFLHENEYCFTQTAPQTGVVLQCDISFATSQIAVSMTNGTFVLFEETLTITGGDEKSRFKLPLKILIYKALHQYTGKKLPWGVLTGIRPVKLVHALFEQGQCPEQAFATLTNFYQLSKSKALLSLDVAANEIKYLNHNQNKVSVYIGIPFCTSRCLYCSFTSFSTQRYGHFIQSYIDALYKEAAWMANYIQTQGITLDTVYIGGGTPTALDEFSLEELLTRIIPLFPMHQVREFTVEAGRPDTITGKKLEMIQAARASRISINPQTMQDKTLRTIGRNHTTEEFIKAFLMARQMGFYNINCDLIVGLPGETNEDFHNTLRGIRELNPESITVHTMAVKRASRLKTEKGGFENSPDPVVAQMVDEAAKAAAEMAMRPYYLYRQKNILANLENVGYAKPGHEGLYNMLIMEEVQTIFALGAGGISKILFPGNRIERIFNVKDVEQYIDRVDEMIERKKRMLFTSKGGTLIWGR